MFTALLHSHCLHTLHVLSFFAIQLKKTTLCCLMLKVAYLFLHWVLAASVVATGVMAVGGSLCYYNSANQQCQDRTSWEKWDQSTTSVHDFHLWTFVHWLLSTDFRPPTFVHRCPSIDVRLSPFIPVDVPYSSNRMYCIHTYPISHSSNRY